MTKKGPTPGWLRFGAQRLRMPAGIIRIRIQYQYTAVIFNGQYKCSTVSQFMAAAAGSSRRRASRRDEAEVERDDDDDDDDSEAGNRGSAGAAESESSSDAPDSDVGRGSHKRKKRRNKTTKNGKKTNKKKKKTQTGAGASPPDAAPAGASAGANADAPRASRSAAGSHRPPDTSARKGRKRSRKTVGDGSSGMHPVFDEEQLETAFWDDEDTVLKAACATGSMDDKDVDFFRFLLLTENLEKFGVFFELSGSHTQLRRQNDLVTSAVQVCLLQTC
jgi:hypothetical protein